MAIRQDMADQEASVRRVGGTGRGRFVLARIAVIALMFGLATPPAAGDCPPFGDYIPTLDVTPRTPTDGAVLTFSLTICNPQTTPLDQTFESFLDRDLFVPGSAVWTSCPPGGCGFAPPEGSPVIAGFPLAGGDCMAFEFTMQLIAGQRGDLVCFQGATRWVPDCDPPFPFPVTTKTDDATVPAVDDPTCVTVDDPAPGCTITALIDPLMVEDCADAGVTLSCAGSSSAGCPGGALDYQWLKAGADIIGATGSTYMIPADTPPGFGDYRCVVTCAALTGCVELSRASRVFLFDPPGDLIAPGVACVSDVVVVYVSGAMSCSIDCGDGSPAIPSCFAECAYAAPGSYTIEAEASDISCTGSALSRTSRSQAPHPRPVLTAYAELCEDAACGPHAARAFQLFARWARLPCGRQALVALDDPTAYEPVLTLPDVTVAYPR